METPNQPVADADLLKELEGSGAILTQPDGITADPLAQKDPLAVEPRVAPTKVAAMDAVHGRKVGGKGYKVTVAGMYYSPAKESKGKVAKPYRLDFNLPSLEGALSIIKNKLLMPALLRMDASATAFQTHEIIDAQPLTGDTPAIDNIQFMDRARLERFIAENQVPVVVAEYDDVRHLRDAVIDHRLNPTNFGKRESERQKERAEMRELLAMNPNLAPVAP